MRAAKWLQDNWNWVTTVILFFTGLILTIIEATRRGDIRPELLILYAGMMGLPAFLPRDLGRSSTSPDDQPRPSPSPPPSALGLGQTDQEITP